MFFQQDTICALSTAPGLGAIAVIRISGPNARAIFQPFFSKDLSAIKSHTLHFGKVTTPENQLLDEVLLSYLERGKSFTGEETLEIACHGSIYIQQELLHLLLRNGCRMAEPGEFTQRAFLNGKLDLSQAEAVADLISSESKKAHEIAIKQMRGAFSSELKNLREKLIHFASLVELELDFAEEDVEFADRTELKSLVEEVIRYLKRLIKSFELGNAIKNGVPVAIVGKPNTGKSTLLNQLLGEERAIVSSIAGTTRDTIEERINIDGILFNLIDTAGIRDGLNETENDQIEAIGIQRSKEKLELAQLVLFLIDSTDFSSHSAETIDWLHELKSTYPEKHFLVLLNKSDIIDLDAATLTSIPFDQLKIAAKTGKGISELKEAMVAQFFKHDFEQQTIVSNARHVEALSKALDSLQQAQTGLETNTTGDFIAMDIRQAMFHVGSITGDISTDDLLGNIFSKFCIGK